MPIGTVKFYNDQKGYGVITPAIKEHPTVFFHFTQLDASEYKTIDPDVVVSYEEGTDRRGRPCALTVRRL